ncbi:hypothetical protein [Acaryochloris sp. IP29b_bin.137]|uniref:hypothetical protein n=1 Tax=Acaryochloris sp. IP29b_bin.137 TaxID=2969217 RepID=UPI00262C77BD|nr:hypothetical protein [Acaryochloris sp. IP29b_bin.137]
MKLLQIGVLTGLATLAFLPIAKAEAMPQKKLDANQHGFAKMAADELPTMRGMGQTYVDPSPTVTVSQQTTTQKAQALKHSLSAVQSNQRVQTIVGNQVFLSGQAQAVYQK